MCVSAAFLSYIVCLCVCVRVSCGAALRGAWFIPHADVTHDMFATRYVFVCICFGYWLVLRVCVLF